MKVWLLIAAASLLLVGCANPAATAPAKTVTVSAAAHVGSETVVWNPVSGCTNHAPYLDVPVAQTGITYMVNGSVVAQTGDLITTAGHYAVTAKGSVLPDGTVITPTATGPWSFTLTAC